MKLKAWADALQRFVLRVLSSFFLTCLVFHGECAMFATTSDVHDLVCVFWQGYLVALCTIWLCFHLLLYQKEQHEPAN